MKDKNLLSNVYGCFTCQGKGCALMDEVIKKRKEHIIVLENPKISQIIVRSIGCFEVKPEDWKFNSARDFCVKESWNWTLRIL
jgi:hypothetical protein